jgi:hypothetical protein
MWEIAAEINNAQMFFEDGPEDVKLGWEEGFEFAPEAETSLLVCDVLLMG